jgi:hypothetical protein
MSWRKHALIYPLGAVVVGAIQYLGTEVGNSMADQPLPVGDDDMIHQELARREEYADSDPVDAAWKGVGYWTALYGLVRFGLHRGFLKSSAVFSAGFVGTTIPLGYSMRSHSSDEGDVDLIASSGLIGGGLSLAAYRLIRRFRQRPAATATTV